MITTNVMSLKDAEQKRVTYSKRDNMEIMKRN